MTVCLCVCVCVLGVGGGEVFDFSHHQHWFFLSTIGFQERQLS